jgi:hypothetical protein
MCCVVCHVGYMHVLLYAVLVNGVCCDVLCVVHVVVCGTLYVVYVVCYVCGVMCWASCGLYVVVCVGCVVRVACVVVWVVVGVFRISW